MQLKLWCLRNLSACGGLVLTAGLAMPALANLPDQLETIPSEITVAQRPEPNRDRLLQPDAEPPAPLPETEPLVPQPQPEKQPEQPTETPAPTIQVRQITVEGSSRFKPEDFAPIIQPLEGRTATLPELRAVADAITQLYLDAGYLTSRAILAEQTVTDGAVTIQVIEGRLSDIRVEGTKRLNRSYIRSRVQTGITVPLRTKQLEEQLRLLKADPLIKNIEANLRAGEAPGESILVLKVTEADPFLLRLSVDNFSPPSLGSERTGLLLSHGNVTGLGDRLSAAYQRSTRGGSEVFEFGYRVPVNALEGTLQLRTILDRNEVVTGPAAALDITGESEFYEVSFRQPLIRRLREELALSLGFSHRDGQTFVFDQGIGFGIGPDDDGVSSSSVIRFGQEYLNRDAQGAWALRSQFNFGVDLFDPTINDAPIPDGRFFSWLGQVQRVQRLGRDHLLIVQTDLQLTPNSLLPSEQFVIGGGPSVRGYRQNARTGDNGIRFSVEDRITLSRNSGGSPIFQLAPFLDLGAVWNTGNNPNNDSRPDQRFLIGGGLGILWELAPGLNLRFDYGIPFIDLDDRGNNFQDDGLYFSVTFEP